MKLIKRTIKLVEDYLWYRRVGYTRRVALNMARNTL